MFNGAVLVYKKSDYKLSNYLVHLLSYRFKLIEKQTKLLLEENEEEFNVNGEISESLASNGPVVDSRDLNLVSGHTEPTHNKLFLSSPTKYTVEPSWPLVLVWPPFELLHHALTTIVFAQ
ncbi:hypothetical protein TNCV_4531301 [Trichonephila clavipes]|nr:hypothetical protein TNCV_4531301 [Trichonephila clavipes]